MDLRGALRFPSATLIVAMISPAGLPAVHAAGASRIPRSALPDVRSLDTIEQREMPRVDVRRLLAEDAELRRSNAPSPARYAINHTVALTPDTSGTWENLDDGSRLWRVRLSSPGALSISLGLEQFDLPAGASFWVHAPDGSGVQGPYTAENRNAFGGLWTAVVLGDELVAELHAPAIGPIDLLISSVNHGYRGFGERAEDAFPEKRGSCNINVVCPEGNRFADQIRSIARYTFSDGMASYLCTGQLINNTTEDETPYLYSAGHCVQTDTEAATLVAYWNYQTTTCEERYGGSLNQNQSGATLIAHSFDSETNFQFDFALLELDQVPDDSFNVFYTGWDRSGIIPDSTVTIHHPTGDEKSISFDNDPPAITTIGGSTSPGDGRHWRIHDWDVGTTEVGSSGACLFDEASGLCIGDLSGGYAACGNNQPDWYARMHGQWTGEDSPETRLSDWLDPNGTGVEYLFGRNPGATAGPSETWLIPSVASTPGVEDSNWKSQISIANPTSSSRSAMVYFVPDGSPWPGHLLSGPHLIGPMGSLYLDDPLLQDNPTAGLMYIMVDGEGTAAFSRTINLGDDGSTFGQGMPAVRLNDAELVTELVLPMVHSAPNRYRTNIGFVQSSAGDFSVWVSIYTAESVLLAERRFAVNGTAWRQINNIFGKLDVGQADVEGGWIHVRLASGSPAYWTTYATVIDDVTGDPTYVAPVAP